VDNNSNRNTQAARGGLHNASSIHDNSSRPGATGATNQKKVIKPNVAESISTDSSDSDN
jgi:hypothetical protein